MSNGTLSEDIAGADVNAHDIDLGKTLISYRILVSRREAGAIIGRNGTNITEIRDSNNVKAGVSKVVSGCIDRILTVSGMVDNLPDALVEVAQSVTNSNVETIEQAKLKKTDPTGLITYDFFPLKPLTQRPAPDEPAYAETLFLRLLIPNSQVGTLIGKAGNRIKQIQESCDVKMVASKGFLQDSTERLVEVEGSSEHIRAALTAISKCLLREYQGTATTTYYLPSAVMPKRDGRTSSSGSHRSSSNGNGSDYSGKEVIKKISFPSDYIGALIGRRGSRIQEIRRDSNCAIAVESDATDGTPEGEDQREVTIIGTKQNVDRASTMLQDYYERERRRRERVAELSSSE